MNSPLSKSSPSFEASLRRTAEEINLNVAYRWFLGYTLQEETPHFSTVSYNFRHRYTEETVDEVFAWSLSEAAEGSTYESNVMPRDDISITKHGLKIPVDTADYDEFAAKMKNSENEFIQAFSLYT